MKSKKRGFRLAALLVVIFAAAAYLVLKPEPPVRRARHKPSPTRPHELKRPSQAKETHDEPRARVAIIIDDMGQDMAALAEIAGFGCPVGVAVLPGLRNSRETAERAEKAGLVVLLHLPMQPKGGSTRGLGPGALMEGMDGARMEKAVMDDLASVPGAAGVNNHMGSALTEDAAAMRSLMALLKARGLFFVDSRTSPYTVAVQEARERGVRAASRKVFLDDLDDPAEIRKQIDRLVKIAIRDGDAVAIGHPRKATLATLREELPGLRERGVAVVRVSELVR